MWVTPMELYHQFLQLNYWRNHVLYNIFELFFYFFFFLPYAQLSLVSTGNFQIVVHTKDLEFTPELTVVMIEP